MSIRRYIGHHKREETGVPVTVQVVIESLNTIIEIHLIGRGVSVFEYMTAIPLW